jgi:hyperosmotically inducible periplasmic protein
MRTRIMRWMIATSLVVLAAGCGQTDAGITTAVKAKLAADNEVKAHQINVDTNDKVVTLSGNMDTATAKMRAVEIARGTDGVTRVVDNVQVMGAMASEPNPSDAARAMYTDGSLTAAVKAKLMGEATFSALLFDVDTDDGVVTLSGTVRTQAEKDLALKLARETTGVKSVTDRLTVRPSP